MSKYRIMLLDFHEDNVKHLHKELTLAGYETIEVFVNEEEALERFRNEKFHVVLIGTTLRQVDGIEVLKKMKTLDTLTQFIVMAEQATIDTMLSCLEVGANDYIFKPLMNVNELIEALQMSIRKLERLKAAMRDNIYNL